MLTQKSALIPLTGRAHGMVYTHTSYPDSLLGNRHGTLPFHGRG